MTLFGCKDRNLRQEVGSTNCSRRRICMLTTRGFLHNAWRCGFYEAQDILSEVDSVDMIPIVPKRYYELRESFQRDIIWHDVTRQIVSLNIAYRPITLTKEYDLFIAFVHQPRDLIHLSALRGWKKYCRTSICWIDEFWAANIPNPRSWLSVLGEFDHIAIGLKGTVKAISEALRVPCHWVPSAVDAMRFNPYPDAPDRVIDVYSIGPIWKELHQTLLEMAAQQKIFYIYDTFFASDARVKDYRHHRELYANKAKRSRYFFVQPAKAYAPEEMKGQVEVGTRFFEASAAGAIMLGHAPNCEAFENMFGWPDAVIEIKPDGSNAAEILSNLAEQPERLRKISRRNSMEALLRHDWVYRWEKILNIAGLAPTPQLEIRKNCLKVMAEQIKTKDNAIC